MKNSTDLHSVLIYAIDEKLHIHSDHVIQNGTIQVYDGAGNKILQKPVDGTEYFSINMNVIRGIYLVRLNTETQSIEKKTFIGKKDQVFIKNNLT